MRCHKVKYLNTKISQPSNRVSLPKCGRVVMRLNKKPVMVYDKKTMPHMAFISPSMETNANYVNNNES